MMGCDDIISIQLSVAAMSKMEHLTQRSSPNSAVAVMDVYSWFRRLKTSLPSATLKNSHEEVAAAQEAEEKFYGITPLLIKFINSFTLETFRSFNLPDDEEVDNGDGGQSQTAGNVRKDLSDWQERHASLILTKVKELAQLRFRLCPRYMKEQVFWRIYFALVKSYVAEYELRAVQLEKLRQMKMENGTSSSVSVYEVEMSETKQAYPVDSADSLDQRLDGD